MQVTLKGTPVAIGGDKLVEVGDPAPVATVTTKDLQEIQVGGARGTVQVLISVPSLDTSVCATETRKFNERLAELPVEAVVISMDLPFAAQRFCSAEGIENLTVASDFRNRDFGRKYGVIIQEGPLRGLLARTIFVVDPDGKVVYRQIVPEITSEPDYDEVLGFLKDLL